MSETQRKACYGSLFPSVLAPASDKPVRGKVFSFQLSTAGGTFRAGYQVFHDAAAWDDCLDCPDFEACYKLSLGRLTLESALSGK